MIVIILNLLIFSFSQDYFANNVRYVKFEMDENLSQVQLSILSIFIYYLSLYIIYLYILSIFIYYLSLYIIYLYILSIFMYYLSLYIIYLYILSIFIYYLSLYIIYLSICFCSILSLIIIWKKFSPSWNISLYPLLFLYCRISFIMLLD